jgi:hypothetical protein
MTAIRTIFLFLATFLLCLWAFVPQNFADTHTAASCSYSDVNSAVSAAAEGDTVSVPSGSCTWNSGLSITKGITLQAAGIGSTTITGNVGNDTFLISYAPSTPANNAAFVLTGFTFDLNSNSLALLLANSDYSHPVNKVRIHHNKFLNCVMSGPHYSGFTIRSGSVLGVFDNNTVTGEFLVHNDAYNVYNWDNLTFSFGDANNFFFEDNTITSGSGSNVNTIGCGWGGRYVARYNTFIYTGAGLFPWFDMHGNQPNGVYACMGAEIYGNYLTSSTVPNGNSVKMFHQRGGEALIFFNKAVSSGGYYLFGIMEEYDDSIDPTTNPEPQHVSNSYYWNNIGDRQGSAMRTDPGIDSDCCGVLIADITYFYQGGTVGVGCGTSLPGTCTTGGGYWLTSQNCSDVDASNMGKSPATPISGTLYKCTATNTWTPYYTPYTYPHPLRSLSERLAPPAPPQNVRITS